MPRRSRPKPSQPCQSTSCLLSWQLAQGTGTERPIWRDREREWGVGSEANTERGIEILREGKASEDMKIWRKERQWQRQRWRGKKRMQRDEREWWSHRDWVHIYVTVSPWGETEAQVCLILRGHILQTAFHHFCTTQGLPQIRKWPRLSLCVLTLLAWLTVWSVKMMAFKNNFLSDSDPGSVHMWCTGNTVN